MDAKPCLHTVYKRVYDIGLNPSDHALGSVCYALKHALPHIAAALLYLAVKVVLRRREPVRYQGPNEVSQSTKGNTQSRVQQRVNLPRKTNPVHCLNAVNNALHEGCPVSLLYHGNQKVQDTNDKCAQGLSGLRPLECLEKCADACCHLIAKLRPVKRGCKFQEQSESPVKPRSYKISKLYPVYCPRNAHEAGSKGSPDSSPVSPNDKSQQTGYLRLEISPNSSSHKSPLYRINHSHKTLR